MTEDKIQHTTALTLCAELTKLSSSISGLQHELVLHYSANNVPSHKTSGGVHRLQNQMERVEEELEEVKAELEKLDR